MAFCFKRKESVSKAVRRVGRERIESALDCLKNWRRADAIHGARKDIKKVRAVLRLVRARITKKAYDRLTGLLRKAAKPLAPSRDASVKIKTLGDLTHRYKGRIAPVALRPLRVALRNAANDATNRFVKEKAAKAVAGTLGRVANELERLEVDGKGWKSIGPGVKTAYSQGRRAYQMARQDSSSENLHEWRKRAKDLWYQVSLLRPVWHEQMDAMASELEALGEYLGDDHDLVMLRDAVEEQRSADGNAPELETLTALIAEWQRELRSAALTFGARFYAEQPATFCERLAAYWQTWRSKNKPYNRAAETTF